MGVSLLDLVFVFPEYPEPYGLFYFILVLFFELIDPLVEVISVLIECKESEFRVGSN